MPSTVWDLPPHEDFMRDHPPQGLRFVSTWYDNAYGPTLRFCTPGMPFLSHEVARLETVGLYKEEKRLHIHVLDRAHRASLYRWAVEFERVYGLKAELHIQKTVAEVLEKGPTE